MDLDLDLGDGHRARLADPGMTEAFALIERMAASPIPVLITGEPGVGKELAARAVHRYSRRRTGPFVAINAGAIPEGLIESTLFGHERGAFTGARTSAAGVLEAAHGGTLFLDEIGELPRHAQVKLLRALDGHAITRLGSVQPVAVDVRFVAATNRDLDEAAANGAFRADLVYRLGGARIHLPPLRDRPRDLHLLARDFLRTARRRLGRGDVEIGAGAMRALERHAWPGNVRELLYAMQWAAVQVDGGEVTVAHLPPTVRGGLPARGATSTPRFRQLADEVRELEIRRMTEALAATGGVRKRAAALLGMPLRTFLRKATIYGVSSSASGAAATPSCHPPTRQPGVLPLGDAPQRADSLRSDDRD